MSDTSACGCCAGLTVETPVGKSNPPGLGALAYRIGEWSSFKASLLSRLSASDFPALAALICGFFWEMWNQYSYPKWEYSIPYVQRFQIFEMPLLGYLGYLPFGLQCRVVADLIERLAGSRRG